MKRLRWLLALLALGLGAAPAPAQILLPGYSYGSFTYGGFGPGLLRPRVRVGFSLGGIYRGPLGYGYLGPSPLLYPRGQVTVYYSLPPLLPPRPRFLDEWKDDIRPRPRATPSAPEREQPRLPAPEPVEPEDAPPLKGDPRGGYHPLAPDNRERAQQPQPADPPKPAEQPKPPAKEPPMMPQLPHPPQPRNDPQAEHARLVELGRSAFTAGEYGRAAQRFHQATLAMPREPIAYFLLAQASFALGKYTDAVDAIHAGMALHPTWPSARFRPVELYGGNAADYNAQVRRLQELVHQRPDDGVLLFLYAHQLWFDGRREEARPFLQRAQSRTANTGDVERFLRALRQPPVI